MCLVSEIVRGGSLQIILAFFIVVKFLHLLYSTNTTDFTNVKVFSEVKLIQSPLQRL